MSKRDFVIKTFLSSDRKSLREIVLRAELMDPESSAFFFQVDEDLDLEFQVTGLSAAVQSFKASDIKLAANFSRVRENSISVQGLIGVDVLK